MPAQDTSHYRAHGRRSASTSEPPLSFDDHLKSLPPDRDSTRRLTPTENVQSVAQQTDPEQRADTDGLRAQSSAETDPGSHSHLDELFQGWGDGPESSLLSLLSISPSAIEGANEVSDPVRLSTLPTDGQNTSLPSKTQLHGGSLPSQRPRSYWWWWEIAAVTFSMACMVAAVVLLAYINDTRLSTWSFYFQPNTAVSILTTLAKSVMLFSVSTCLSQLKWRHFQTMPAGRPLNHLEDFDDASRGPLGSLLMLGNHRLAAFIPSMLALITVASLAIDPMAQQVLKFPSKDFRLQNISGGIGQAISYRVNLDSPFTSGIYNEYPLSITQQAQLLASITGAKQHEPQFSCPPPATRCSWDIFSSLAICGTFSNLTDTASRNCTTLHYPSSQSSSPLPNATYDKFLNVSCNISLVDMRTFPLTMTWYTGRTNAEAFEQAATSESTHGPLNCGHYDLLDASVERPGKLYGSTSHETQLAMSSKDQLSGLYAKLHVVRTLDHETPYNITGARDYNNAMWQLPMRTEFLRASWHFCEQVYSDVSVDLGVLSVGNVTRNPLTLVAWSPSYTLYSNASGLNYSISNVYGGNGEWDPSSLSQFFDLHLGYTPTPRVSNPTYSSSDSSRIFYSIVQDDHAETFTEALYPASALTRSLSIYLRSADIEALTNNLASTLTARIRSNTTGGNVNLTMLPGQAFVNEAYIAVQWPWMILPITETVLAAAALAMTIVLTRQQALLKGSTVSLLMHQIDGWGPEKTKVRRLDTSEQLRDRAKEMVVRLDEGRDGEMVFKREY